VGHDCLEEDEEKLGAVRVLSFSFIHKGKVEGVEVVRQSEDCRNT